MSAYLPSICITYEFIFFETITVHVHGLLCGEIQVSEEFEYLHMYKHYRGAVKEFSVFQNKIDGRNSLGYVQEKIYLGKINLIVHFLKFYVYK